MTPVNRPASVVLITIDSLRYDHLSCYGYKRQTTPFIDWLCANGTRFDDVYATSPMTPGSFKSIMTSTYPLTGGWTPFLEGWRPCLAEMLRSAGYFTVALHSNPWLSRYYGYDRGFDSFDDYLSATPRDPQPERHTMGISFLNDIRSRLPKNHRSYSVLFLAKWLLGLRQDVDGLRLVLDVARLNPRQPTFLWLHFMDAHTPYLRHSMSGRLTGSIANYFMNFHKEMIAPWIPNLIKLYDSAVKQVDRCVAMLYRELERLGLGLDNSVYIVTGDHGEEFLEHGKTSHSARLYNELLHVPLILAGPGIPRRSNSGVRRSLLDVLPTILESVGSQTSNIAGSSLFTPVTIQPTICEVALGPRALGGAAAYGQAYSVLRSDLKYIVYFDRARSLVHEELYDIAEDPAEMVNLCTSKPSVLKTFRNAVSNHIDREERRFITLKLRHSGLGEPPKTVGKG